MCVQNMPFVVINHEMTKYSRFLFSHGPLSWRDIYFKIKEKEMINLKSQTDVSLQISVSIPHRIWMHEVLKMWYFL